MKPLGHGNLIEDRFDSVFRRNLMEPEPKEGDNKKRVKKAFFKFHQSKGETNQKLKAATE